MMLSSRQGGLAAAGLAVAALAGLLLSLPWSGAWLRMTGSVWQDQVEVPLFLFWYAAPFLLGLLLGRRDPWLGLLVAYVGALGLLRASYEGVAAVQYVLAAGILVWCVRDLAEARPGAADLLVTVLVVGAVIQALYALPQAFGYDPAWWGLERRTDMRPIGSIRGSNLLAIYLAVIVPLAPRWVLPILLGGLALTLSALGMLSATAGLLVRERHRWRPRVLLLRAAGGLAAAWALHPGAPASLLLRLRVWRTGLGDAWAAPIFGHGLGGWAERVSVLHGTQVPADGFPIHAHNELVQFAHEGGLLALLIVAIGVLGHRALWRHPRYGGAVVASAVACLGHAPLHLASTALVILVIYGLATASPGGFLLPGTATGPAHSRVSATERTV